jgi:hypothetical protein
VGDVVAASLEAATFFNLPLLSKKGNQVKYESFVQGAPLTLNEVFY